MSRGRIRRGVLSALVGVGVIAGSARCTPGDLGISLPAEFLDETYNRDVAAASIDRENIYAAKLHESGENNLNDPEELLGRDSTPAIFKCSPEEPLRVVVSFSWRFERITTEIYSNPRTEAYIKAGAATPFNLLGGIGGEGFLFTEGRTQSSSATLIPYSPWTGGGQNQTDTRRGDERHFMLEVIPAKECEIKIYSLQRNVD